jgi:glycosyltransferase involved in cell wall biosynthesis
VGLATTRESAEAMERLGAPAVTVATASVALDGSEIERLAALPVRSGGPLRFVAIGRLLHWKGYDLALRAFADARKQSAALADAEFWIAGDGPERAYLAALAESLGVADRVALLGDLPRAECLDRMAACDVLVHPSFHDSGGYATLEGMAAGRPVVCLALGGPALQVTPEVGIAVEAHTPEQVEADLARAFVRLAEDDGLRARMGAAGRGRVAEVYTWDRIVEEVLALYPVALHAEAAWGEPLGGAAGRDVPDLALA